MFPFIINISIRIRLNAIYLCSTFIILNINVLISINSTVNKLIFINSTVNKYIFIKICYILLKKLK